MEVVGLLTVPRVRDITSPLLWRPAGAGDGYGAKLPENYTNSPYQGKMVRASMARAC
jgi:hypothetical protein